MEAFSVQRWPVPLSELCEVRGGQGRSDLAEDNFQSLGFNGGGGGCSRVTIAMRCSLIWCTPEETGRLVRITDRRLLWTGFKGENSLEYRVWDEETTENLHLVMLRQKCWSGLYFYFRSWNFCLLHIVCVLCHPGWDVFPSLPCLCYLCLCLCLVSNNKGTSPHRLSFPDFVSS